MTGQDILATQKDLEARRSTFEDHWTDVARLVLTRQDDFEGSRQPGEKRTQYQFDSAAPLALEKSSSAVESVVTPRTGKWHSLRPPIIKGEASVEDMQRYEWMRDFLFYKRYNDSNFASQWYETIVSMLAFGTGVMLVEDVPGKGIRYKSLHLSECFIVEDENGEINTMYRKFKLTGQNAINFYGNDLPAKTRDMCEQNKLDEFTFVQRVMPNKLANPGSVNRRRQTYTSDHVDVNTGLIIRSGGYRKFPFIIIRYFTAPGEIYGRGPSMSALAEIKMVNQMRKTDLRARRMAVDPPFLTASEASVRRLNFKSRALNYGGLDENGQPRVRALETGSRMDLSQDAIDRSHETINDAFLITLFQILVDTPQMTATEAMKRDQEKSALLAPTMGRIQIEGVGKLVERELDIYMFNGMLDEAPYDFVSEPFEYEIEFTAPINQMMNSQEAIAASTTVQSLVPVAQIDPTVFSSVNWEEYTRIVAKGQGAPSKMFYTRGEMEERKAAQQQAQQQQQMIEAAPQLAGAVKDIAQAQSIG